jgi:hemoglobin
MLLKGAPMRVSPSPQAGAVTETMIHDLVHEFYRRIRADEVLGPIFARAIGPEENWGPHLAKMCDFWSSVMLMSGRYHGKPMVAHMKVKSIRPEHFAHWLTLFEEAAHDVAGPEAGAVFTEKAKRIAHSLQLGLFFRPEEADGAKAARN